MTIGSDQLDAWGRQRASGSDPRVTEEQRIDFPHYVTDEFPYAEGDRLRREPDRSEWDATDRRRWENHRVTPWRYAATLRAQGNACAICGTQDPGKRGWHIDHDHSCCPGKTSCGLCVRGILCGRCNIGLGFFLDNINALRAAEAYLERADASATYGDTPRED